MFVNDLISSSEKAELAQQPVELVSLQTGSALAATTTMSLTENTVNVLLNFEIKEVKIFKCCDELDSGFSLQTETI